MKIANPIINDDSITTSHLCKRISTESIKDTIDEYLGRINKYLGRNPENSRSVENGELIGFGIFQTSQYTNYHDIELKPIYLKAEEIPEEGLQPGESNLRVEFGTISLDGERRKLSSGVWIDALDSDEIQFFNELVDHENGAYKFDFAFISLNDIQLLIEFSEYITISGAKIDTGEPTLQSAQPPQGSTFFTFKVESEFDENVEHFPQLLLACPCPPYWKHLSDT